MNGILYQKTGLTVSRIAQDLLSREVGDRVPAITEYMEKFQASRGTVQNSLTYLKERQAVSLVSRGHMGTFIRALDHHKLQEFTLTRELLGTMPLAYSRTYKGLATALYDTLSRFSVNLVYSRGSSGRLKLVASGACQFAVCSRYAAERAVQIQKDLKIACDLGPGTYLSRHVLVLRDPEATGITPGMRVAYDRDSLDQREITELITQGIENIEFVDMRSHQTVGAIRKGIIDAGIWNLDEILDAGYDDLNIVELDPTAYTDAFSSAVLVIKSGEEPLEQLLRRYVLPERVQKIQEDVRAGVLDVNY